MFRLIAILPCLILSLSSPAFAAPPDGLLLSHSTIAENLPAETVIGTFTTLDPDPGDTHTYILIENPLDLFAIEGNTLRTTRSLDYEAGSQRQIRVRTTDSAGAWLERNFTIFILDRNDPPLGVSLSVSGVPETTPVYGLVGTVSQVGDQDQNDSWTFRLVDDAQGHFILEGNQLRVALPLDSETEPVLVIIVEVTDRGGLSAQSAISIAIWDRNEPPRGVILSPFTIAETAPLGTAVGTLSAFGDPDFNDSHTFAVVTSGSGQSPFIVHGSTLRVASTLDFETAPVRTIRIRVTDRGGLFAESDVTVFVEDRNEVPTGVRLLGAMGLPENAPSGTLVGQLEGIDQDVGDSHLFELVDAADATRFFIDEDRLVALASFDYEVTPVVSVRIRVTDAGGLSAVVALNLQILDRNEAPTNILLSGTSVHETAPNNAIVGFISVVDPDAGDSHELYLLQDGNGSFRIDNRILRKSGPLDFETAPTVTILMIAFDRGGLSFVKSFVIDIIDVDEPATDIAVNPSAVAENRPVGTVVGDLIPVGDPDSAEGYQWVLVENPGNRFAIVGDQLVTNAVFDFEANRSHQVRIRAIPPIGPPIERLVTIDITDEPEPPTGIAVSGTTIQENRNAGTFVATLQALGDPDASEVHVFSLVENPELAFTIQGNTLSTAKVLDFEARSLHPVVIRATDRAGLYVEVPFEIRVIDVNEPPTGVAISNRFIPENSPPNSVVGRLSPVGDPDIVDRYTYQLTANPEDRFDIAGDTLIARVTFDYETPPVSHRVVVRVSDQGNLTAETAFFIEVTDVNEPPSAITLANRNIPENAPAGTVVDIIGGGVDPEVGDIAIFEILVGQGFAVDAERRLVTTRAFDHETEPTVDVVVRLSDSGQNAVQAAWTITIEDRPEPPTGVGLSHSVILESRPAGSLVGRLSALGDPDVGDSHTFAIASDPDEVFVLVGDELRLARMVDFETKTSHEVWVTATDTTDLSATTRHVILVLDDNDPPTTSASFELPSIAEDDMASVGVPVSVLEAGLLLEDEDSEDVWLEVVALSTPEDDVLGRWELRGGEGWGPLAVGARLPAAERLRFVPEPDDNGRATLVVRASDGSASGPPATLAIEVRPVNDAPRHIIGTGRIETFEQARTFVADSLGVPLSTSDVDAEILRVTLTTPRGLVTLPTNDLIVRSGASGTSSVALEGTIPALNAALGELFFTGASRFTGETTLVLTSEDLGATGEGGPKSTSDTIVIVAAAAPDLAVAGPDGEIPAEQTWSAGALGVGAYHHVPFVLENRGSVTLDLLESPDEPGLDAGSGSHGLAIVEQVNAEAWLSVKPALRIPPGQSTRGVITVRPRAVGPVSVTLAVESNDPEPALWRAVMTASASLAPDLELRDGARVLQSGQAHTIADLVPGQTRKVELTLHNSGAARLELGATEVLLANGLEVVLEEPFPLLDPGETDRLSVFLTAVAPGRAQVLLSTPTNDPDARTLEIRLVADVVTTPAARLSLERVPGVFIPTGAVDDMGFGRVGRDLGLSLRLVNLGARPVAGVAVGTSNAINAASRLALDLPETLEPGRVVDFLLFVRPDEPGPFAVRLDAGTDSWTFEGEALSAAAEVPPQALALYRPGAGRVVDVDPLGPVTVGEVATHAWLLVNEGPDPIILKRPFALSRLVNVDATPMRQPTTNIPSQRASAVPVAIEARSSGRIELDLEPSDHPLVRVESEGQVGAIGVELENGQRLQPNSVVTLPLQRVGQPVVVKVLVVNDGNGPLAVAAPVLDGGPFCKGVTGPDRPLLGRAERAVLQLTLEPVAGEFRCTLVIASDDALRPSFGVTFAARGTTVGSKDTGCAQGGGASGPPAVALAIAIVALMTVRRTRRGVRAARA